MPDAHAVAVVVSVGPIPAKCQHAPLDPLFLEDPTEWGRLEAALDAERGSAYILGEDLSILYCNEGFRRFARDNGAPELAATDWSTAGPIIRFISGSARDFFRQRFASVFRHKEAWLQVYECSSPDCFRQLSMRVECLTRGKGLVVVHSAAVEVPFPVNQALLSELVQGFTDARGLIVQCAACGRFRRPTKLPRWDWVPGLAQFPETASKTSHGICPTCEFQFYG